MDAVPEIDSFAGLPGYSESLELFHRAFEAEIAGLIEGLPIPGGGRSLDVPCGDGFFTHMLAARAGAGEVVAADVSDEFLHVARGRCGSLPNVTFREADIYGLPFEGGSFDFVWCAQSLISLPRALDALREIGRVLRPGGLVSVLEEDALHNVILPWPADLELAVQAALREANEGEDRNPDKLYYGRRLAHLLAEAGLEPADKQTLAWDRRGPLGEADRAYFADYLAGLRGRLGDRLSAETAELLACLSDPDSPAFLPADPAFEATYLGMLSLGRKSAL